MSTALCTFRYNSRGGDLSPSAFGTNKGQRGITIPFAKLYSLLLSGLLGNNLYTLSFDRRFAALVDICLRTIVLKSQPAARNFLMSLATAEDGISNPSAHSFSYSVVFVCGNVGVFKYCTYALCCWHCLWPVVLDACGYNVLNEIFVMTAHMRCVRDFRTPWSAACRNVYRSRIVCTLRSAHARCVRYFRTPWSAAYQCRRWV